MPLRYTVFSYQYKHGSCGGGGGGVGTDRINQCANNPFSTGSPFGNYLVMPNFATDPSTPMV